MQQATDTYPLNQFLLQDVLGDGGCLFRALANLFWFWWTLLDKEAPENLGYGSPFPFQPSSISTFAEWNTRLQDAVLRRNSAVGQQLLNKTWHQWIQDILSQHARFNAVLLVCNNDRGTQRPTVFALAQRLWDMREVASLQEPTATPLQSFLNPTAGATTRPSPQDAVRLLGLLPDWDYLQTVSLEPDTYPFEGNLDLTASEAVAAQGGLLQRAPVNQRAYFRGYCGRAAHLDQQADNVLTRGAVEYLQIVVEVVTLSDEDRSQYVRLDRIEPSTVAPLFAQAIALPYWFGRLGCHYGALYPRTYVDTSTFLIENATAVLPAGSRCVSGGTTCFPSASSSAPSAFAPFQPASSSGSPFASLFPAPASSSPFTSLFPAPFSAPTSTTSPFSTPTGATFTVGTAPRPSIRARPISELRARLPTFQPTASSVSSFPLPSVASNRARELYGVYGATTPILQRLPLSSFVTAYENYTLLEGVPPPTYLHVLLFEVGIFPVTINTVLAEAPPGSINTVEDYYRYIAASRSSVPSSGFSFTPISSVASLTAQPLAEAAVERRLYAEYLRDTSEPIAEPGFALMLNDFVETVGRNPTDYQQVLNVGNNSGARHLYLLYLRDNPGPNVVPFTAFYEAYFQLRRAGNSGIITVAEVLAQVAGRTFAELLYAEYERSTSEPIEEEAFQRRLREFRDVVGRDPTNYQQVIDVGGYYGGRLYLLYLRDNPSAIVPFEAFTSAYRALLIARRSSPTSVREVLAEVDAESRSSEEEEEELPMSRPVPLVFAGGSTSASGGSFGFNIPRTAPPTPSAPPLTPSARTAVGDTLEQQERLYEQVNARLGALRQGSLFSFAFRLSNLLEEAGTLLSALGQDAQLRQMLEDLMAVSRRRGEELQNTLRNG